MQIVCGVDLGATNARIVIAEPTGRILTQDRARTPTGTTGPELARWLAARIEGLAGGEPASLAIGLPGAVHPLTGLIRSAPNLPQIEGAAFAAALPGAIFLNDTNAALLGEVRAGAVRGRHDVVMITVGTGVGTAVLFGGKPLTGRSGVIGEFGDLPYGEGTFEDACSGAALTRAARERGFDDPRAVFTRPALRDVHDRAFTALSIILKTVTTAYEPEAIVLGGGVAHSLDAWCAPLARELSKITPEPPEVLITRLGDDAGVLGAMHLAKEALLVPAATA